MASIITSSKVKQCNLSKQCNGIALQGHVMAEPVDEYQCTLIEQSHVIFKLSII